MRRLSLAFLAVAVAALPARAALPDGLYTTQAPMQGAPTPVGFNSSSRSGFTLRIDGKIWRLAQPILPLDFTWLKPWMENEQAGVIVRVRGVAGSDPASAAERLRKNWLVALGSMPFRTEDGLPGIRVLFGGAGKAGLSVTRAAYLLPNRQGFVYAFVAEPWPRGGAPWRVAKTDSSLPTDALMKSAAWEKERVGYRP